MIKGTIIEYATDTSLWGFHFHLWKFF